MGQPASFAGEHGVHHVCRPDAIGRAVRNLIDNAIKYGGQEPATIFARREGEEVVISVTDLGKGIPPRDLGRIFEKFYR
ncbi:MAG: ATP-binding protein, partial [Lysobacterales bacterium]